MTKQRLPERASWRHYRFIVLGQPRGSQPNRLPAPVLVLQVHRGTDSDPARNLFAQLPEIGQQLTDLSYTVADPLQLMDPFQELSLVRAVAGRVTIAQAGDELLFSLTQLAPLGLQSLFIRQSACPLAWSDVEHHATMVNRQRLRFNLHKAGDLHALAATTGIPPKNREGSLFRRGPLATLADLEEVTSAWVHWHNNERLMHRPGGVPPPKPMPTTTLRPPRPTGPDTQTECALDHSGVGFRRKSKQRSTPGASMGRRPSVKSEKPENERK